MLLAHGITARVTTHQITARVTTHQPKTGARHHSPAEYPTRGGTVVLEAPAYRRSDWPLPGAPPPTRPEQAAERLAELAAGAEPGTRLGTKDELRTLCGVSVGTFNEALRLVQARGLVTVRAGRVGGLFASRQSPIVRLGNSVLAIDDDATSVADAVRIRDALEPLLVEDGARHRSAEDTGELRQCLARMRAAANALDGIEFIHANWALHARIAEISPSAMLRSFYLSLLEMIESHTLSVRSVADEPLPEYLDNRYRLHADLVAAIEDQDAGRALDLLRVHNAPVAEASTTAATTAEASPTATTAAASTAAATTITTAMTAPAPAGGQGTSE
jgi:DNA-binding FadR family transcriptional regulator